jgi:four helix bundle protein
MLILARELGKISESDFELLFKQAEEISRMISGLIKTL